MFRGLTIINKYTCFVDCKHVDELYDENYNLTQENKNLHRNFQLINLLKKFNTQYENILGIYEHNGNDCYIVVKYNFDCYGKIISLEFMEYIYGPYGNQLGTCYLRSSFGYDKSLRFLGEIYIADFTCNIPNQGYGTVMMKTFLEYMLHFKVKKITGHLSWVDFERAPDHKQMLIHFYEKFGFTTENDSLFLSLS